MESSSILNTCEDDFDLVVQPLEESAIRSSEKLLGESGGEHASPHGTKISEAKQTWAEFLLAWTSMVLAILSGAAIGPAFKYMALHHIPARLAASWRCQTMTLFLLPLAFMEALCGKKNNAIDWFARPPELQYPLYVHVAIAGVAWGVNLVFWISGLAYTTTVRASIMASLHPLMLVFVLSLSGKKKVTAIEWAGTCISILGIVVATSRGLFHFVNNTSDEDNVASTAKKQMLGDVLCIMASAAEVGVILNRTATKKHVPLFMYTTITTLQVAIFVSIASVVLDDTERGRVGIFCIDENCIFGWVSHTWLLKMLLFGLVIGVVCIAGFNYAIQFIPPLVFSSILLVDPAVTGVISWLLGLEGIPDYLTFIGGTTVVLGTATIAYGEGTPREVERGSSGACADGVELVATGDKGKRDVSVYSILPHTEDDE